MFYSIELEFAISTRETLINGLADLTNNFKFTSLSTVNQLTAAASAVLSQPSQVSLSAATTALSLLDNVVSAVSANSWLVATSTDAYSNRELTASASNMLSCMGFILDSTNLQGVPNGYQVGSGITPLRTVSPSMKSYLKRQAALIASYMLTIKESFLSKKVDGVFQIT